MAKKQWVHQLRDGRDYLCESALHLHILQCEMCHMRLANIMGVNTSRVYQWALADTAMRASYLAMLERTGKTLCLIPIADLTLLTGLRGIAAARPNKVANKDAD